MVLDGDPTGRRARWALKIELYDWTIGKRPLEQWSPYNLTLLQLEQTTGSFGQRGTAPPTEPGFSQGFFSVLSRMEFSFLWLA